MITTEGSTTEAHEFAGRGGICERLFGTPTGRGTEHDRCGLPREAPIHSTSAPADTRIVFEHGDTGPCSACGDGDTAQRYHKHGEPAAPSEAREVPERIWIDDIKGGDDERYIYTAPCPPELADTIHTTEYILRSTHQSEVEKLQRIAETQGANIAALYKQRRAEEKKNEQLTAEVERLKEALRGLRARTIEGWGECWCENNPFYSTNIVDHESACAAARATLASAGEE